MYRKRDRYTNAHACTDCRYTYVCVHEYISLYARTHAHIGLFCTYVIMKRHLQDPYLSVALLGSQGARLLCEPRVPACSGAGGARVTPQGSFWLLVVAPIQIQIYMKDAASVGHISHKTCAKRVVSVGAIQGYWGLLGKSSMIPGGLRAIGSYSEPASVSGAH